MNNEETIIMQPKNNEKANETQNSSNIETGKKSGMGKKVAAATAAAAMFGGAAGSGATYAATGMLNDSDAEEQEVQATEEPTSEAKVEEEPQVAETKEEATPTVEATAETDYTNNNGADPVTANPEVHATSNDTSADGNEVQVLGVYETKQTMDR